MRKYQKVVNTSWKIGELPNFELHTIAAGTAHMKRMPNTNDEPK